MKFFPNEIWVTKRGNIIIKSFINRRVCLNWWKWFWALCCGGNQGIPNNGVGCQPNPCTKDKLKNQT